MRWFTRLEIFLGGLLAGLVVAMFAFALASYQAEHCRNIENGGHGYSETESGKSAPESEDQNRENEVSRYAVRHQWACEVRGFPVMAMFFVDHHEGFFVAIFTLMLFGATIALWRSTDKLWAGGEALRESSIAIAQEQAGIARASNVMAQRSATAAAEAAAGTHFAASATEAGVELAKETAEKQMRAYVHVEYTRVSNLFGKSEFVIQIKNFGHTPAHNLRSWNTVILIHNEVARDYKRLPKQLSANLGELGPSAGTFIPKRGPDLSNTDEAKAIIANEANIFYFGEIEYEDVFGKTRTTAFRYMVRSNDGLNLPNMFICSDDNWSN